MRGRDDERERGKRQSELTVFGEFSPEAHQRITHQLKLIEINKTRLKLTEIDCLISNSDDIHQKWVKQGRVL